MHRSTQWSLTTSTSAHRPSLAISLALVQQYRTVHYTSRLMPTFTSHSHGDPRFKASRAKEIIGSVLKARLTGAAYHADNTSSWAREIADDIKAQLKGELECGVGGKCA